MVNIFRILVILAQQLLSIEKGKLRILDDARREFDEAREEVRYAEATFDHLLAIGS